MGRQRGNESWGLAFKALLLIMLLPMIIRLGVVSLVIIAALIVFTLVKKL